MAGEAPTPSLAGRLAVALRSLREARPARRWPSYRVSALLLAAIPLLTAIGAEGLAIAKDAGNRVVMRVAADRLSAHRAAIEAAAARMRIAPALTRPTASGLAERLAAFLPPGDRVRLLAIDDKGAISAEIECADPDALRAALAADPLGRRLRMTGQSPAADGVRIVLGSIS